MRPKKFPIVVRVKYGGMKLYEECCHVFGSPYSRDVAPDGRWRHDYNGRVHMHYFMFHDESDAVLFKLATGAGGVT